MDRDTLMLVMGGGPDLMNYFGVSWFFFLRFVSLRTLVIATLSYLIGGGG